MARSTTERLAEKTIEWQFLYEMETDFELAPAASRAMLATAQQVLLVSGGEPRQGQMRVTVVRGGMVLKMPPVRPGRPLRTSRGRGSAGPDVAQL